MATAGTGAAGTPEFSILPVTICTSPMAYLPGDILPADMHDLNTPFAGHLGRAEGLIWRDAASVSAEMWGELRQDQSCRLTD